MRGWSREEYHRQAAILGLGSPQTIEEIDGAYRSLVSKWHPDKHLGEDARAEATRRTQDINGAYGFLKRAFKAGLIPVARYARSSANPYPGAGKSAPPGSNTRPKPSATSGPGKPGFPDPEVVEIPVVSSYIRSVGYSARDRILYVRYYNKYRREERACRYLDVPQGLFDSILIAKSKGAAVAYLYGRYEEECLWEL